MTNCKVPAQYNTIYLKLIELQYLQFPFYNTINNFSRINTFLKLQATKLGKIIQIFVVAFPSVHVEVHEYINFRKCRSQ